MSSLPPGLIMILAAIGLPFIPHVWRQIFMLGAIAFSASGLVIGDGTSSKAWQQQLQHLAPMRIVKEAGTTLRARDRYWQIWPARGWRRLLPKGLQLPPGELDGIAALVLLEDQLPQPLTWSHPPQQGPGLRTVPAR